MYSELLAEYGRSIFLELSNDTLSRFKEYKNLVLEYNKKINLTAITDERDFYIKHFIDSISAAPYIPMGAKVIDIGSGAGFPSIPLKLVRDDLKITMLDALGKRVDFLNHVIAELGLKDCLSVHLRAEDGAKGKLRGSADVVTARAVADIRTLLEYAIPLLKIGGRFIAYKTDSGEELSLAKNAMKELGADVEKINEFYLPQINDKRALIVFKKVKPTPNKYPRGGGKEKKAPL